MSGFDQIMSKYVEYTEDPYYDNSHLKRELNYRFGVENVKNWLDNYFQKGTKNERPSERIN